MIRTTLAALTTATILLAGCSAASAPVGLKESCDALGVVLQDFGQTAPTAQRYAEFLPKVRAIQERGDATTKGALQPLVAAMDSGAQGDASVTLGAHLAATVGLMAQCATAGSTALAPASSAPPSPTPAARLLDTEDYYAAVDETKRACDGGICAVTARVGVGYVGDEDHPGRAVVTFTIRGSESDTRSLRVDGNAVPTVVVTMDVPKGDKLSVTVDRAEAVE